MKIEDHEVWSSLAGYISTILNDLDFRSLSNICHSFYRVSHGKPVMLNFDDLFSEMELPIIQKLDQILHNPTLTDPKGVASVVMAYSKTQNGSVQFYQAMEKHVLACKDKLSSYEIANIVYSYSKSSSADKELLVNLEGKVAEVLNKANTQELTNILAGYA
jgi:hypothetical protein